MGPPEPPQTKDEPAKTEIMCSKLKRKQLIFNQETDVKHHLRNIIKIPVVKLQRIDVQQRHVCKEESEIEMQVFKQNRTSHLDQAEPEPAQVKKEPEESENMCSDQKGEQLVLNQEPDMKEDMMNGSSNQNKVPILDQTKPESPQIKEELDEQCISREGESLLLIQETDVKVDFHSYCDETHKIYKKLKLESSDLLDQHHHLGNILKIPVVKLQRADVQQQHVCEERKQGRTSSLEQAEPELPQLKEEPDDLYYNHEGERLLLNQETDVMTHQHQLRNIQLQTIGVWDKWQLCNQERNLCLDQPEPEPPRVNEEPEKLCSDLEEEQLLQNQEFKSKCEETCKIFENFTFEFKELLKHQHHLKDMIKIPVVKLQRIDDQQQHVCEEDGDDWQLYKQKRNSGPDQPELPQIKEEPEETNIMCNNQEREQLVLNKEADMTMENPSECEETFKGWDIKEPLDHQYCLRTSETESHKIDVQQQHVCTEEDDDEWQFYKQERHSSRDQEEPELPQNKKLPEKLSCNQEGDQLLLNLNEAEMKMDSQSKCEETSEDCETNEMLDHQYCQRIRIPETKSHTTGVWDKWQLCNQERNLCLDQAEPEPPRVKEEPEKLCSDLEEEQLLQNQEFKSKCEEKCKIFENFKFEFKELLKHQHLLKDMIRIPVVKLQRIDDQQQHVCEEDRDEWQLYKQKRNSSPDQPELPQIKEEPEETNIMCNNQEREQLVLNKEADMTTENPSECEETFKGWDIKEPLDHQYCLRTSETESHKIGIWDKWKLCNQERKLCLDQPEPEPPKVKEEPEKLCSDLEGDHLLQNQEFKSKCEETCKIFENFKFEFKELLKHQHLLKDMIRIPVVKLQRIDLSGKHICKEETKAEQLLWKQERHSSPDEEKPELPEIKDEQEEEEEEQVELTQETDASMVTEYDQEKINSKPVPRESPVLEANTRIRNSDAVTVQDFTLHSTHTRIHTVDMPYSCKICQKKYTRNSKLKSHMSTHIRPFTCELCEKGFSKMTQLKVHMRTHAGERPFTCEVCHKSFGRNTSLKEHMKIHTGFTCILCAKSFAQSKSLNNHMRTHPREKLFICHICLKCFMQSEPLKEHMKAHVDERPFTCDLCKKMFAQSESFKEHMRTHTREMVYSCKVYEKYFACRSNLYAHFLTHTGERPFTCKVCQKYFAQIKSLKDQMRTHTGERSFHL